MIKRAIAKKKKKTSLSFSLSLPSDLLGRLAMEVDIEDSMGISPVHFLAGAIAGTAEHCGMYPVDTIKVRPFSRYCQV
jgi:hypothetical protein